MFPERYSLRNTYRVSLRDGIYGIYFVSHVIDVVLGIVNVGPMLGRIVAVETL